MRIYRMLSDILKSSSAQSANHKVKIFEAELHHLELHQCLTWWTREWRPCIYMWCPGFYAHLFTRGFSTNNYVEGLNFALKSMLVLRPNLRVDSMCLTIFEMFVPKYIKRHLDRNVDTWDGRQYRKKTFPPEFGKRTLVVLEGLQARLEKGKKISITRIDSSNASNGIYRFQKSTSVLRAEYMLFQARSGDVRQPTESVDTPSMAEHLAQRNEHGSTTGVKKAREVHDATRAPQEPGRQPSQMDDEFIIDRQPTKRKRTKEEKEAEEQAIRVAVDRGEPLGPDHLQMRGMKCLQSRGCMHHQVLQGMRVATLKSLLVSVGFTCKSKCNKEWLISSLIGRSPISQNNNTTIPVFRNIQTTTTTPASKRAVVAQDPAAPLNVQEEGILASISACQDPVAVVYTSELNFLNRLSRYDVGCLLGEEQPDAPKGHLNDEVINAYMELLMKRELKKEGPPRCHMMNSWFHEKLMECGGTIFRHEQASRWVTVDRLGYDIFQCEKIIIPVHQMIRKATKKKDDTCHWVLVVVDIRQRKIIYFNSAKGTGKLHRPGGLNIVVHPSYYVNTECMHIE
eukprot:7557482-Pyramimonas_sp.AAC.1